MTSSNQSHCLVENDADAIIYVPEKSFSVKNLFTRSISSPYRAKYSSCFDLRKLNANSNVNIHQRSKRTVSPSKMVSKLGPNRDFSKENQDEAVIISAPKTSTTPHQSQNPGEFPFQYLPSICKFNVMSFLDEKEKIDCMGVCREWSFVKHPSLWRHVNLTEFCNSESKLSSFVSFLESFNCRLQSVKISFNEMKANMSLNVLLQSEVVSKLESVTIDWSVSHNNETTLIPTPTEMPNNRRHQRRFRDFFTNVCTHLPNITHLSTIFDWSLPNITTLSRLTSLKNLSLNQFPDLFSHFEQPLFTSLMQSLSSLESLCIEMTGTVVSGYESIRIASDTLRHLDLSKCKGFTLTEVNLPRMHQLILPPKLNNPLTFNNFLFLPTKLPQLQDEIKEPLVIEKHGFREIASKRDRCDVGGENISNCEGVVDDGSVKDDELSADALARISSSNAYDEGNMLSNQQHHLLSNLTHHDNRKINGNYLGIKSNNLSNNTTNVNKTISDDDLDDNNNNNNNNNDDNKNDNDDNNNNDSSNNNNNNNNNSNNNKGTVRYRCVSKVLDEGCPRLVKVNGLPVSQLKLNNSNNNKHNNKNNKKINNNEMGILNFDNGVEYGGNYITDEYNCNNNNHMIKRSEYKDNKEKVAIINVDKNTSGDVNGCVNLDINVDNNIKRMKNHKNNKAYNHVNKNSKINVGTVDDFAKASGADMNYKNFKNNFNTGNYSGGFICIKNQLKDGGSDNIIRNNVSQISSGIVNKSGGNVIPNNNNNSSYYIEDDAGLPKYHPPMKEIFDNNCYLRSHCPSSHDQSKSE